MEREKVIKGLETCSQKTVLYVCSQCPYNNDDDDTYDCTQALAEDAWKAIQNKAKKNIETNDSACGAVFQHWRKIANGQVPFGYRVVERI